MDTHGFALIAAAVVLFGLVSKRLEGTIITAPMVFAAFGLLIGEPVGRQDRLFYEFDLEDMVLCDLPRQSVNVSSAACQF